MYTVCVVCLFWLVTLAFKKGHRPHYLALKGAGFAAIEIFSYSLPFIKILIFKNQTKK